MFYRVSNGGSGIDDFAFVNGASGQWHNDYGNSTTFNINISSKTKFLVVAYTNGCGGVSSIVPNNGTRLFHYNDSLSTMCTMIMDNPNTVASLTINTNFWSHGYVNYYVTIYSLD